MATDNSDYVIPAGQLRLHHDKVSREADKIVHFCIWGYFFFGLLLSVFYDTWNLGIVMGGTSIGIYYFLRTLFQDTIFTRIIISLLLWNFAVQFIFQMHGMYEMHFFYFISLTVLLFYEDVRVMLPAIIYAILTFLFIFYLKLSGNDLNGYLENVNDLTYINAIMHIAILLLYGGLAIVWSMKQRKQTQHAAKRQIQMKERLQQMEVNIEFANSISKGDLKAEYNAEKADKLGESLMNMRKSLLKAKGREDRERFINVGLATIGEVLRSNSESLTELCDKLIEELVDYMKVNQGGIFIIEQDEATSEDYLELKAARAYERKKYLQKRIEIGQGLVGQAAIEREKIHLKEVPENYINITSGLGLATPRSLLIMPLKSNEDLVGVIELASFQDFSDTDIEFLEKVGESIASTIISVRTNQQTKELLEQSHQLTEELRAQEEEMRQNIEEMQATQEEMVRTQQELAEKESNLNALINNTTDSIITIDRNYNIIIMNDVLRERYRGTQFEKMDIGDNVIDSLGNEGEAWKKYYDRALEGERLNFTIKSTVNGEGSWREYFINPVKSDKGEITGVSVFSRNVTDKIQVQQEIIKTENVLYALIDNTTSAYFACDTDYKVIVANQALRDRFGKSGIDIKVGTNILSVLGDASDEWKQHYDRALSGEAFIVQQERKFGGNIFFIEANYGPIKDDDNNIIGAYMISRDITEKQTALDKVRKLTAQIQQLKATAK